MLEEQSHWWLLCIENDFILTHCWWMNLPSKWLLLNCLLCVVCFLSLWNFSVRLCGCSLFWCCSRYQAMLVVCSTVCVHVYIILLSFFLDFRTNQCPEMVMAQLQVPLRDLFPQLKFCPSSQSMCVPCPLSLLPRHEKNCRKNRSGDFEMCRLSETWCAKITLTLGHV